MANEVRVVLVSDPTPEFPKNKNNSFKVRLPIQLPLTGPGWKVALHSISLPHTTHRYPDRLVDNDVKWPIQFGSWGNKLSDHGEYVWSGYATRDVLLNSADGIHMMKLVQSYMHAYNLVFKVDFLPLDCNPHQARWGILHLKATFKVRGKGTIL